MGYPTPKCPRVVENYVHSKSYTSATRQCGTHFTGTSNIHVSHGAVACRIPVKGLQTDGVFLSCEPSGAEQAASPAPLPGLTPCTQAPSSRGLDVSAEGEVAQPWPSAPLMKCAEKMQHTGCLARVQGGKKKKFFVKRLGSRRTSKGRHLTILWVGQFWPQRIASWGVGPLGC